MNAEPQAATPRFEHAKSAVQRFYPGLAAATAIAVAATWLSQHYGAPVMLLALLLGAAFHFLAETPRCLPGLEVASKTLLRFGVALLGVRITTDQIASLGPAPIGIIFAAVATTIVVGLLLALALGVGGWRGVLMGGAVAICGASAALAISAAVPRSSVEDKDVAVTIAIVTTLSTLAMVVYPAIATATHMTDANAGIFLGGAIHDVAQVLGAGYIISPAAGDIAAYVKLVRVTLLLPVLLLIAFIGSRSNPSLPGTQRGLPFFLVAFAAIVGLNSLNVIPAPVRDAATEFSQWSIVIAVVALGAKTSPRALFTVGVRPLAVLVGSTLWIAAVTFAATWCLR